MNILASPWATGTWQMAAEDKSVGELKSLLACTKPAGELKCLIHAFGSVDRCLRCFLRAIDGNAAKAAARIESTLAFRREQRLDEYTCRADLEKAFESHPLRRHLPVAFAGTAPDGTIIQYARMRSMNMRELVAASNEGELRQLVALWLECALQLQGESTRERGEPCKGTYDVYDMKGTNMWSLLWDAKETRHVIGPVLSMGEAHFPENLCKCYVINASSLFGAIWKIATPFLSQRTVDKVSISSSVPGELVYVLGGPSKVHEMMASVPESSGA